MNILSRVINRGLETSGRLSEVTIELLDKPGQLRDVADIIAKTGANVTKVSHRDKAAKTPTSTVYLADFQEQETTPIVGN